MAYPTVESIIKNTIQNMGLVTGIGVQQYTEPQIKSSINRMMLFLLGKRRWEHLTHWHNFTLDATTGRTVGDWDSCEQWEDVHEVRVGNTEQMIVSPVTTEHLYTTGSEALYRTVIPWDDAEAETKIFQFWPFTATGTVDVLYTHRPTAVIAPHDIVPFDEAIINFAVMWDVVSTDGLNPAAAEKAQALFDITFQDWMGKNNAKEIGFGKTFRDRRIVSIQP